jgi:hypothetical protein
MEARVFSLFLLKLGQVFIKEGGVLAAQQDVFPFLHLLFEAHLSGEGGCHDLGTRLRTSEAWLLAFW